jgi:uncharacterized membrane protein
MRSDMTLIILITGLILFLGTHSYSLRRASRAALVAKVGPELYKVVYSVLSLTGFVLIIWGYASYRVTGYIPLWNPPVWTRHLAALIMLPALPLLLASFGYGFIKARLKHPMILAVKTWSLAHLLANGDLGSIILFGTFLAWAVVAFINMRRRPAEAGPALIPNPGHDATAILGGIFFYLAMVLGAHKYLIGVGVFG